MQSLSTSLVASPQEESMKLAPGNIWSGNRRLAVFTNPTELAFRKGMLKNHYPLTVDLLTYPDLEAAYQVMSKDMKHDMIPLKALMIGLMHLKLEQYPVLVETIRESGGFEWITRCCHYATMKPRKNARWEGNGLDSAFIECLFNAFKYFR
jgi:hypothetical protein